MIVNCFCVRLAQQTLQKTLITTGSCVRPATRSACTAAAGDLGTFPSWRAPPRSDRDRTCASAPRPPYPLRLTFFSLSQPTRILHDLARGTRNERRAVEHDAAVVAELLADPVARHHRHVVRRRVALHRATPMAAADQRVVLRLAADGGGVHQHLRAHQRHDASRFGEPLVPANRNAKFTVFRVPDLETRVAGAEVELLFVARSIGNVALSVYSQNLSVRVDNGNRVVVGLVVSLVEGDGEYHL